MFRLIKLTLYAAMGYVLYELVMGMVGQGDEMSRQGGRSGPSRGNRDLRRALNEDAGRMNLTGTGRGQTVSVEDDSGAQHRQVVGRGVTS